MDLFRKVRALLGALAQKPWAPKPPRTEPKPGSDRPKVAHAAPTRRAIQQQDTNEPEEGRVADLIEQQKQALEQGDEPDGADRVGAAEP